MPPRPEASVAELVQRNLEPSGQIPRINALISLIAMEVNYDDSPTTGYNAVAEAADSAKRQGFIPPLPKEVADTLGVVAHKLETGALVLAKRIAANSSFRGDQVHPVEENIRGVKQLLAAIVLSDRGLTVEQHLRIHADARHDSRNPLYFRQGERRAY